VLTRRIYDPISVILPGDDAVDWPTSDVLGYFGADADGKICDESRLRLVDGKTPTRFTLRQLTHKQRIAAHGYDTMSFAQQLFVVRCALLRVTGFEVGSAPMSEPERSRDGDLGELVSAEWLLDKARLGNDDIGALAIAAVAISENKRPLLRALGPLYGARG